MSVSLSVRLRVCLSPSVRMEKLVYHGIDVYEIKYLRLFRKFVKKKLKYNRITSTLDEDIRTRTFVIISR